MNRSFSKIRHIQEVNQSLEKRLITEQPGHQRNVFPPKPGWTHDLAHLTGNQLKWDEQKKKYFGQGKDGIYHFYAPRNNRNEFRKVGSNGVNTMGEYVIDTNSKEPFIGIKIVSQNNVPTKPGTQFV